MKTLAYTFLFFCIPFITLAQAGRGDEMEGQAVGRVAGQLAISPTGAATYSVPIVVPPGIKEVVPSIALTYNSQGSDGVAGWGWNLAGLSSISRISATLYHDGAIDPVDFDELDRFALDGQRLLLKNPKATYGAAETEYQTENYNNIKVIAKGQITVNGGTVPNYFIVYYPDGSRAWYGKNSSFAQLEWAISHWEDPQGNRIDYSYSSNTGILQIEKISYGGKEKNSHPNHIEFEYVSKKVRRVNYIHNVIFSRAHLLKQIKVVNGTQTYREYEIKYDQNSSGYDRLVKIVEKNHIGNAKPEVVFDYESLTEISGSDQIDDLSSLSQKKNPNSKKATFQFDPEKHRLFAGDFNGDQYFDMIIREGSTYSILFSGPNNTSLPIQKKPIPINAGAQLHSFVAGHFQDEQNRILQQQAFISIDQKRIERAVFNSYPGANDDYSEMTFTTYAITDEYGNLDSYSKKWDNELYNYEYDSCGEEKVNLIDKDYFPADFTGDGLSDILMIEKPYTTKSCDQRNSECKCTDRKRYARRLFLVDMDRNKKTDFISHLGNIEIKEFDHIRLADFDGDGIPDLWHLSENKIAVYGIQKKSLNKLTEMNNEGFKTATHSLIGDFNGDGKADLLKPLGAGKFYWHLYSSTGTHFRYDYLKLNVNYVLSEGEYVDWERHYSIRNYIHTQDVDGDGTSDLIYHNQTNQNSRVTVYRNVGTADGWLRNFKFAYSSTFKTEDTNGAPLTYNVHQSEFNPVYVFVSGSKVYQTQLKLDHRQEMQLNRISQKGMEHLISYNPLGQNSTYFSNQEQLYPYVNINNGLTIPLVNKVKTSVGNLSTTQQFRYYGAVSHVGGLGFLGFMGVARTNAYGSNVAALWSLSLHNPILRGAITHSWSTRNNPFYRNGTGFNLTQSGFFQKTTYQYQPPIKSENGVFNAPLDNMKTEDALTGFTTFQSYSYDRYFNATEILTERNGGKTLQKLSYSHQPDAKNENYHIGRLLKETTTETWEGITHRTQKSYTYEKNLLKTQTTQGNGSESLTETLSYDTFGNLTSKIMSTEGLDPRSESFTYTADGRFLESKTDIAKLTTHFSYFADGSLQSETDPFGNTTTYGYDGWQRPSQITDYLGNVSTFTYSWFGDLVLRTTEGATGSQTRNFSDAWGRTVAEGTLGLNNQWSWVNKRFDAAGRVFQASEPYTSVLPIEVVPLQNPTGTTPPTQWTTNRYDAYGRIFSQQLPTGKTLKTTYTQGKPTVTVDDGYRKVTTTTDARGNIAEMTDNNGTIRYTYHPTGGLLQSDFEGHVVKVEYDEWGRKTALHDPSVGDFSYAYDTYGQLLEDTSPSGTTTYQYNGLGQLVFKKQEGENTQLATDYTYYPNSQQLKTQTTVDAILRETHSYGFTYDPYQRLKTQKEENGYARFEQTFTYDAFGRNLSETRMAQYKGGATQQLDISRGYAANGQLERLLADQKEVWRVNTHNARGQHTQITLGNGIVQQRQYDALGYLDNIEEGAALTLSLQYNKRQGVLTGRTRNETTEHFQYDKLSRLTRIQKGLEVNTQDYDDLGRIADNSSIGAYQYTQNKRFVLDSVVLNATGVKYYTEHSKQTVAYNIDRKAVSVHEVGFGRADFAYNADMQRIHAWYGSEEENRNNRTFEKHYSSLFPAEITKNNETGKTDIVLYIGGDAYSAPVAKIKDEIHYLHRDHLGSILAISDSSGTVVEERQFGAWGEIDFFKQNGQISDFSESILPRGYTGHEHFAEITLIHMNGRMYDPMMHRFLSPDNYIQDPYDTRSYDRFGYVWNNPLMNVDPTGEDLATLYLIAKILYAVFKVGQTIVRYSEGTYRGPLPVILTTLNVVLTFTGLPVEGGQYVDFGDTVSEGLGNLLNLGIHVAAFELSQLGLMEQNKMQNIKRIDFEDDINSMSSNSQADTPCPFPIAPENCEALGYRPSGEGYENTDFGTASNIPKVAIGVAPSGGTRGGADEDQEEDNEEEEEEETWYLDNDNDGYHSEIRISKDKPLGGNWISTTNGEDCDDSDASKKEKGDCFDINDPCANKDLRNKEVSEAVKNQISNRTQFAGTANSGNTINLQSFTIQDIDDLISTGDLNLDKYELNITRLPNGVSAQQLFEEIRHNFFTLVKGGNNFLSKAEFMSYSDQDFNLWTSSNPLGAGMDFKTFLDTATVITSEYSLDEMYWTFTTVRSADHLGHPVSGHRQFRLRDNQDGSYSFVVRGADRLATPVDWALNETFNDFAFDLADDTWKNLMENIEKFIKNKTGSEVTPFDKNKEYGKRHYYNEDDCQD